MVTLSQLIGKILGMYEIREKDQESSMYTIYTKLLRTELYNQWVPIPIVFHGGLELSVQLHCNYPVLEWKIVLAQGQLNS